MEQVRKDMYMSVIRHPTATQAVIGLAVAAVTLLHYLTSAHLLEYHTVYRSLYYLPIAGAAVAFGLRGGLLMAGIVLGLYLPHVLSMGAMLPGGLVDNLLELPVFVLVGGLIGWLADGERTQRRRAESLRSYIDSVLQSLPLGVATVAGSTEPRPQNRAAHALLAALPANSTPVLRSPGYYRFEQGERPLGLYVSPLDPNAASEDTHVLVIEDQTERRALEAQLRRMDRLASVGQLAAGIAHEVRNPLAIVRATAQLLTGQLADHPAMDQYLRVLISESDRIEHKIGELLEYARPHPPHHVAHDLHSALAEAIRQVRPYALQHQITLMLDAPAGASLWADQAQIQQVLVNLLLNAIQASPPHTAVRLSAMAAADGVTMYVTDEGCGMAAEVRERACDPFFTTRPEGTGLGLALVAAMLQEHAGRLNITSTPGRGTVVTLHLPPEEASNGSCLARR